MADSEYPDDDRPRRRRDDDDRPRKKGCSGWMIALAIVGALGLVCVGVCGFGGYWVFQQAKAVAELSEGFLAKVGSGDLSGAYAQTSPDFKSKYTLEQFTENMTKARLTEFQSVVWTSNQSNRQNDSGTAELSGPATLKDGTTVPVTLKIRFDGKNWTIDDVTAGSAGGTKPTTPSSGK